MGQTKFKAQIPIILWLTVVFGFSSVNAEGYSCYNDYCNSDPNFPQYCYDNQQRCKACDDATKLCGGPEMVLNCTRFCLDWKMKEQKEKECAGAAIPAIVNGSSDGNNFGTFKQNSTVNFSCDGGFTLNGSAITCGPFGQWSPAPRCQANVCVLPKVDGLIIQPVAAQYTVSTRVSVTCNGNKHSVVLTCSPSGTWDLPIPSCDNVKIGVAHFFGNGHENMKVQQERTETRIDEDVGNAHQPMETYKQPCPETTREQCSKEPVFPSASKQRGPVLTL